MKYGRFREDGKEFHVENVATPSPWINYLSNGRYFSTISANGGGISYIGNPLHGRITRYRINDVPPDRPGKYVYIRDKETGEYWSLTWQPVARNRDAYRAAHGFGYTRIESSINDIESEVVYFVPPDSDLEVWDIRLTNRSDRPRRLEVVGYVEFCLGHALVDLINQCDDQHFNRVYFDPAQNALFATKTYWVTETRGTQHQENKAWDHWAFFCCSHPVASYETQRERFIGPFRSESNPTSVEKGDLSSLDTDFGNVIGALKVDLDLEPGDFTDIIFNLGVVLKEQKKPAAPKKYRHSCEVKIGLERVRYSWDRFFKHAVVETPDTQMNTFLNYWTPYQAKVAYDVGRVASFYYWGIGRGFGFRDMAQDLLAVTISKPEEARERVCLLARQMFADGSVYHHFYGDGQGEKTAHCDDPLWFILAVTEYIKETGDLSLLTEMESFQDREDGTILDHLEAVIRFAGNNLGPHGLPVFGRGDWSDTLDYIGGDQGGESVWGGMFYVAMLNGFLKLQEAADVDECKSEVFDLRNRLSEALKTHCWDGEWYIRAFGSGGKRIGSKDNAAGRIFLNPQSWAVIAGLDDQTHLIQALDSVKAHLDSEFGPKICSPAYRKIDPSVGLITRCVAGKKENAAVFLHPTAWLILAECLLGRGEAAYDYYMKLLPNALDSDVFEAEPYVYSQYITSDEHVTAGKASHSWQTGTAAWMYRVMLDYFLGIRPTYKGLRIDPVIPSDWEGFSVERVFRGTRYFIRFENPRGVQRGIESIRINGQNLEGQVLPLSSDTKCNVHVRMG